MQKIIDKSQSGRSMIEIIGVLAVMAVMTAGTIALIQSARATQQRNTVIEDFSQIVTGVRTLFADYDNLETLTDGDGVMAAMAIDNNSPYENATYSVALDNSDNTKQQFVVSLIGAPEDECFVLSQKAWADAVKAPVVHCDSQPTSIEVYYRK